MMPADLLGNEAAQDAPTKISAGKCC
jgi:hypothetical protein